MALPLPLEQTGTVNIPISAWSAPSN